MQHIAVCGLSLHIGSSERRKTLVQKFTFQIGTLNPYGIHAPKQIEIQHYMATEVYSQFLRTNI